MNRAPSRDVAYTFAASLPHASDPAARACSTAPRTDARARGRLSARPSAHCRNAVSTASTHASIDSSRPTSPSVR